MLNKLNDVNNNVNVDFVTLMNFYTKFQNENKIWVERNFHTQQFSVAHEPLLGIFEEIGELYSVGENKDDAPTLTKFIDACGDIMVFMCDYCSCVGFVLYDLVQKAKNSGPFIDLLSSDYDIEEQHAFLLRTIGKLSHAHLKLIQNIRLNENHLINIENALIVIIRYIIWVLICLDSKNLTLEECISKTWCIVKSRNWVNNKIDGK